MLISFFEEFPTKENLSRLQYVTWPTKLYLAAKSVEEFNALKSTIKNKHVIEYIYWPILQRREGYWISPFSKRKALIRIFNELEGKKIPVMIDAELPTTQNLVLYVSQGCNFFRNRSLIRNFIKNYPKVFVAEYYPEGRIKERLLSFLGLHFNPSMYKSNVIKMIYHSMHSFDKEFITNKLTQGVKKFGKNYLVAYGTIDSGIMGNEHLLTLRQLKEDLNIAQKTGMKEIIIFRLGGLNRKYAKVLKTFL